MADLKDGSTSYPTSKDTATIVGAETALPDHINGATQAIVAIENEIGVGLKGTQADLVTRLAKNIHDDGGVLRGTSFPVSPPNLPHYFWRTDLSQLYIYNTDTASYQRVDATNIHANLSGLSADDHAQYVHNTTARTITAQHTISPGSAKPPFVLGANAQGQKVVGLESDKLDGAHASATPGASTIPLADGSGKLAAGWGGAASTIATLDSNTRIVEAANKISDGTNIFHVKSVAIGDWDMTAAIPGPAHFVNVSTGISVAKVRTVHVVIVNDAGTVWADLLTGQFGAAINGWAAPYEGGVGLYAKIGGEYDTTDYNATSYNRGYITIWYVE